MNFNSHSPSLITKHAFLSPSNPAWVNYDLDKLERVYFTHLAAKRGSEIHDFACRAIKLGIKLPDTTATLNQYVNDAIGYRMIPEQILRYSDNCFGTTDAIKFINNKLRIHDLKTGIIEASFKQPLIYAALFCLEYMFKPFDIDIELRIYQNDDYKVLEPDPTEVFQIMDKIVTFDKRINYLRMEAE